MRRLVIAAMAGALALGPGITHAADEEAPATGAFSRTGSLAQARHVWEAVPLPEGRVLVFSGGCHASSTPSLEVWDPDTGAFSPAGSLAIGRCWYTATPLNDGRVLIMGGGRSNRGMSQRARVWDPETGSVEDAGKLDPPRWDHTATRLADGRVLIVGGSSSDETFRPLSSVQIWDPATASFSTAGSLTEARHGHTATLLPDGRVLVVGGAGDDLLASSELWDPATGTFGPTGSLVQPRIEEHTALLLTDGRVLMSGGRDDDERPLPDEVWDPATGRFTTTPAVVWSDYESTATVLPDGRIVVIGGGDEFEGADVWDPATWSSAPAGELLRSRGAHAATLLPDGRVLVVGGWGTDGDLASAEIWDPNAMPMPVSEEFERVGLPSVFGNRNDDGVIVLDDEGFCSYLLGGIWNQGSVVSTDLVLSQGDGQAVQEAVDMDARYPATDEDLLARCIGTLNRFGATEPDADAQEWSTEHPVIPQAFEGLIGDDASTGSRRQRMEPSSTSVLEMEMMLGVRQDLQGTCLPRRTGLLGKAVAAIECKPNVRGVDAVRVYLFDGGRGARDAYFRRLTKAGVELPQEHHPGLHGASFVGGDRRAHYLIPAGPLLFEVIGSGRKVAPVSRFAWLGNQDQPGGPTICCGGGSPKK